MYYEEKIFDGILCWRGSPSGTWVEFTNEQLTRKLQEMKSNRK